MITSFSGLIELGVSPTVEYCDNVIEQSSTGKLDLLRFPVYIPPSSSSAPAIEIKNIKNESDESL